MALADFVEDDAGLQIACQRILARQCTSGVLTWLCAQVLASPEPQRALWQAVDDLESDNLGAALAYALPDDARLCVVGWSDAVEAVVKRRGDVTALVIDTDHDIERRLLSLDEGSAVEFVPVVGAGQAVAVSTHVIVAVDAVSATSALVPQGATAVAACARLMEAQLWAVASLGTVLPDRMYAGVVRRWHDADHEPLWFRDHEELSADLIDSVVTSAGVCNVVAAVAASGCPIVAELF